MSERRIDFWRFSWFLTFLIALVGIPSAGGAQATQTHGFSSSEFWTDETIEPAVEHASDLIQKCLGDAKDYYSCISVPYEVCESEHGTSTSAMIDCAKVTRLAWKGVHDETLSRITRLKTGGLFGPPEENVQALVESNAAWEKWMPQDCLIQVASYKGGTLYPLARSKCMAWGYSKRAIDLINFLWVWDR